MFKKTYQDNLRKLRKEYKPPTIESEPTADPFNTNVYDLSDEDVDPINHVFLYRKTFAAAKHNYLIKPPNVDRTPRKNIFLDVEAILPSLIPNCNVVDADFLTGYYLVKFHMNLPYLLSSFHAGMSKDSFNRGIYYALLKRAKKTNWKMLGCDANPDDKYKPVTYNGIKLPCDIYNDNTHNSINIQLSEAIDMKSIDLYTCDIVSKSTADVVKQLTLIREFLSDKAYILLRLPADWEDLYTSISMFLLYCVSYYKTVKVIKTPWGAKPRLYLLLQGCKTNILPAVYMSLNTYVKDYNPNLPLINQSYFNVTDQDSVMMKINKAYELYDISTIISADDAIQLWSRMVE